MWGRSNPHRDTLAILDGDEEMRRAVASLPARGKHDSLLQLWVRGLVVDWRGLYPAHARLRRLVLPGYPFAEQRYWVQGSPTPGPDAPMAAPVPEAAPAAVEPLPALTPAPAPAVPSAAPIAQALPGNASAAPVAQALAALVKIAAAVLEVEPEVLDVDTELGEYGFDSITMTGFATKTNAALGLGPDPGGFLRVRHPGPPGWSHCFAAGLRCPGRRSVRLRPGCACRNPRTCHAASPPGPGGQSSPRSGPGACCRYRPRRMRRIPSPSSASAAACPWPRMPKRSGKTWWMGGDCISEIPRRALGLAGGLRRSPRWSRPRPTSVGPASSTGVEFEFDPLFFGISPREAKLMDPQQRLMMMHVWKAIEDAGHAPREWAGRAVGLFVATSSSGYREMIGEDTGGEGYVATGAVPSVGPNRASYFLDWHGPSEPVETACSSSLVALHRAIQSIRNGDCEMAVVGGVNTIVTPEAHINFAKAGMLSPDGHCHTFSAQANGYARGEGGRDGRPAPSVRGPGGTATTSTPWSGAAPSTTAAGPIP